MLFHGDKLPKPIPINSSIWNWIFEDALPNCEFNASQLGGFRDARTNEYLSFSAVKSESVYLSTAIANRFGIKLGSHVAIFCQNSIWYPIVNFGAIRLGAIVTASSPEYGVDEMVHILKTSGSELIYADASSWNAVCEAAGNTNIKADRIIFVGEPTEAHRFNGTIATIHDLINEAKTKGDLSQAKAWCLTPIQNNKNIPAYLSFTSGTTSLPKGVMISHHNVIAQLMQMRHLSLKICPKTLLAILPFYHITGIVHLLQLPLVLNQEVISISKFNMQEMLDAIVRFKCEELWLVPPLLIRLVNDPVATKYKLEFVHQFNTGAAPLAKEIINKLAIKFPHVRIRQAWGMTESCSALTLSPTKEQTYEKAFTVGKAVPETVIKIIEAGHDGTKGKILGAGESGEVLAKGPQVAMGYYQQLEATAQAFDSEGFLHTGDIGFMDESGFLVIHDRLKEMVKVKGVAVAPAEVEDLLLGHAIVADAAVIGIPDDYAGEVLKAFVVPKNMADGSPETAKLLMDFVKQTKSKPKWLAGGLDFLEVIPKSSSGKVLRRVLREQEKVKGNKRDERFGAKL